MLSYTVLAASVDIDVYHCAEHPDFDVVIRVLVCALPSCTILVFKTSKSYASSIS